MTQSQADSKPLSTTDKLARIREQRAKLKAQFDAIQSAENSDEALLAKEEQSLADETALMAAAAKYGPIGVKWDALKTRLGVVVVRRSSDTHFKIYQEDPTFSFEKTEAFVKRCVEYPGAGAFDELYRELPGVIADLANLINKLMGVQAGERVKK